MTTIGDDNYRELQHIIFEQQINSKGALEFACQLKMESRHRPKRVVRQGVQRISVSEATEKLQAGNNIFLIIWLTFVAIPILGVWYMYSTHYGLEWWQTSIVYQVYPRSFQDSNGDGVGDIAGAFEIIQFI